MVSKRHREQQRRRQRRRHCRTGQDRTVYRLPVVAMRPGRLLVGAVAVPCVWRAACVGAQDTFGGTVQQRTDAAAAAADVTPRVGGETHGNDNPLPRAGSTSSCGPSALYNRTIDASRYKFGCPEIEVSDSAVPAELRPSVL